MKFLQRLPILLLLLMATTLYGQMQDIRLRRNFKKIDIPFETVNNFIVMDIIFMDAFPLKFIFDTGAEHTVLTKREFTDLMMINYDRKFKIIGSDLSRETYAYLARGINMKMGDLEAINRSILVLEEDYFRFEEFAGMNIQGIIGADFFHRFVVKINFRKQVITLYDPASFKPPRGKAHELPIELKRRKPYIYAHTSFPNGDTVSLKYLIDTGASLPLLLHTNTHPRMKLPTHVIKSNIGMGLGGYLQGFLGRIQKIEISEEIVIPEVITSFQDIGDAIDTTLINGRNGIIGNQLLNRFTIYLDYFRNKIYLIPVGKINRKFRYDRSGILLAASGKNLRTYIVFGIVENSPAAEAGIIPGDEIRSINGLPATLQTLDAINKILQKKPGKRIRVTFRRNNRKMRREFYLRDLI